ncbi:hypothetical protein C1645_836985 [Glomus cerebriforme]|uniref:Uncharacterized protein n=1 Tax=Glomus cerebriforme TaxID=658196 RepID=A0A397S7J3_9GLOM|nr:hypothetical protein C1645_836985 [Glomus cerebriforme]
MNINNYSQKNLNNNVYEPNFTEVINRFNNSDNLSQTNVIQVGPSQNVNDMYSPIMYSNNVNNVAIFDQQSMSNDYDNVSNNHYQPMSNDASVASYNNVTVSNDTSSALYNPYRQPISNDTLYNNFSMSNKYYQQNDASYNNFATTIDVSYDPSMPSDASYNNNSIISQYNQHPSTPNNFSSFNSINITINSPQNISEIFRHGFKIIIMPTNSNAQDQQDYTNYLDCSSQTQFKQ